MGDLFQPVHLIVLFVVFGVFFLLPTIFYILTLQKTLAKCAASSRTLDPTMIWLCLVPFVNLIFNFFVVLGMAKSIQNEFRRRGVPVADPSYGQSLGLAMSICACCGIIPILGVIAGVASLVLWIIYWVKIAEYSRALDIYPQPTSQVTVS